MSSQKESSPLMIDKGPNLCEKCRSNEIREYANFSIHPESCRLIAFVGFWVMSAVAATVTYLKVDPWPYSYDNPIHKEFGFTNICINWDFVPSMYITAVLYVFVEMPILIYCITFWVRTLEECNNGKLPVIYFRFCTFVTVVECLGFSLFRMVFVIRSTEWYHITYMNILGGLM
jgi:hypothetical protein